MRRSAILVVSVSLGLCACTPATVKVWPSSGVPVSSNDGGIVVQAGDSLYGIASRNGVSVIDLAQANGIAEPFLIHPGDRLRLPAKSASKPPVARAPAASTVRTEALPDTSVPAKAKAPATKQPTPKNTATNAAAPKTPAKASTSKAATSTSVATKTLDAEVTRWQWPANGTLLNAPARGDAAPRALDIAGAAGSPVRAVAAGEVVGFGRGSPG